MEVGAWAQRTGVSNGNDFDFLYEGNKGDNMTFT